MSTPPADPAVKTAVIAGERRAYQYMRLLDLGEQDEATALLEPLDDRALGAVALGLARVARSLGGRLPERDQRAHAAHAQNELARGLGPYMRVAGLTAWVAANGDEAMRVITELWPDQAQRLPFYETMGRATYDAGEADRDVRRRYFGG